LSKVGPAKATPDNAITTAITNIHTFDSFICFLLPLH
jgi:hypothetical protein